MASMRFPRANLSGTEFGEVEQDRREAACNQPHAIDLSDRIAGRRGNSEGEFERQGWQDYFFLAPNVRFTRTPDREARKSKPEDGEQAREATAQSVQSKPRQSPVSATTASPISPAAQAPQPRPASLQRVVESAQVLAPTAHAAMIPAPTALPNQPVADTALAASAVVTDTRWSYLSDHAFFEFEASCGVDLAAQPVPAAALAQVVLPRPMPFAAAQGTATAPRRVEPTQIPGHAVTSLYRVIEVPSSLQQAPADVEATATEHPAPAAAKGFEAPAPIEAPIIVPAELPAPASMRVAANDAAPARTIEVTMPAPRQTPSLPMAGKLIQVEASGDYELPSEELLQLPPEGQGFYMSQEQLEQNADLLESVLEDFGVKGEIIHVRPGPVVTLYEFEPAPGVKSSRVIGLADDIARSMSAVSARVAVVPGRNVIGIELPNETRETVYFRELIGSDGFRNTACKLALCLGKTIGGEPVIAELAKMPHLLVAGTTGSGKSVAINTMILSLLYRLKPEECRLIMVDPKMLELSIYDGIPHLLTPVVTDPKKAVTALKWAVREMEDRYRKMARLGVRNIDGYNQRAAIARDKGETVVMQVQTGFEKGTGAPLFEEQEIDLAPMPYIVVIVDEMADLMMVAGKEIEGAIQRLAQMARAAGIHLIMATQRPSVDVITGTIKANFPTRISFQVTSKIDSRTILGEQGAEQLLGQGDMLHMAGGGRIARVHGPFVSDAEVEHVVAHLKAQGRPEYLETVTADEEDEAPEVDDSPVFDKSAMGAEDGDAIYDEAVKVVLRDKKCSTSYIQRRLGIGYNRAASLVERMEKEGIVGGPNHVGKREIIR
jgi:S-DNA-T family DNA segregation ATPase FtsK/SpoIIIE